MVAVKIIGLRTDFPKRNRKIPFREGVNTVKNGLPALVLPVLILGSILMGIASPTEAAVIAVFYATLIALFVYRTVKSGDLVEVVKDSAIETGSVSIIIAAAALFGWVLSNEQVPQYFAQFLVDNVDSKIMILLLINIMLFILGMFMDAIPAIMIVTPVFLPLFKVLEIDPLHAGVFMSINLITGLATPPVGCCLFAASIISNESMEKISITILPFLAANIVVVLLVTYVPFISTFIPSLFP